MSILPSYLSSTIQAQTATAAVVEMPKEYEVDFETGQLTGRIVEGVEAIKVWIWCCLHTQRFRYPIYSWNYGADLEQYVGQTLTDEYLETDLRDEIEEALKVNQYITGIDDYAFERTGSNITVSFSVQTLFGSITEEYDDNI